MEGKPFRVLPRVTPDTEPFWSAGAQGTLRFLRCQDCGRYVHPPAPVCPDLHRHLEWEDVSGRATVLSVTVNHQSWYPGLDPPYTVAIVCIDEDPKVRLMTNIVECDPHSVSIGDAVEVVFDQYDDVWLPMFRPAVR